MNCYTNLFPHGLRVSHCCGEESIPFDSAVKASPVIVAVTSVWQTPWNEGVILFVHWVTCFASSTSTHAPYSTRWRSPLLLVWMCVFPEENTICYQTSNYTWKECLITIKLLIANYGIHSNKTSLRFSEHQQNFNVNPTCKNTMFKIHIWVYCIRLPLIQGWLTFWTPCTNFFHF